MRFRRVGLVLVGLLVVLASLAGCVAGSEVAWPDREVAVDIDTALAAQDMAMAGAMMGSATLSEAELSSLVTFLAKQNLAGLLPVESIKIWLEPGNQIFMEMVPGAGAPLAGPIKVAGMLDVVDNMIQMDVADASIAGVSVYGPLLDVISGAINRALGDPSLGVAVDAATDEGTVTIGLGM
jgi:hypothetical protein